MAAEDSIDLTRRFFDSRADTSPESDAMESSSSLNFGLLDSTISFLKQTNPPALLELDQKTSLDICTAVVHTRIIASSTRHMVYSPLLVATLNELWPDVWKWSEYILRCSIPSQSLGMKFHATALRAITETIIKLSHSEVISETMRNAPGVVHTLACCWLDRTGAYMLNVPGEVPRNSFTAPLHRLLQHAKNSHPYEEVLRAGGHDTKVISARLLEELLDVPDSLDTGLSKAVHSLGLLAGVLLHGEISLYDTFFPRAIRCILRCLRFLAHQEVSSPLIRHATRDCYQILTGGFLTCKTGSWLLCYALRRGLTVSIVRSESIFVSIDNPPGWDCKEMFRCVLCPFLVYRPVIRAAMRGIERADAFARTLGSRGTLYECWRDFCKLARLRERAVGEFRDSILRSCFFAECRRDPEGPKSRTCAVCQRVLYCSKRCQMLDWPRHEPHCSPFDRNLSTNLRSSDGRTAEPWTPRDRQFLMYLAAKDIIAQREVIQRGISQRQGPAPFVPYIFFELDYTRTPFAFTTKALSDLGEQERQSAFRFEHALVFRIISRTSRFEYSMVRVLGVFDTDSLKNLLQSETWML